MCISVRGLSVYTTLGMLPCEQCLYFAEPTRLDLIEQELIRLDETDDEWVDGSLLNNVLQRLRRDDYIAALELELAELQQAAAAAEAAAKQSKLQQDGLAGDSPSRSASRGAEMSELGDSSDDSDDYGNVQGGYSGSDVSDNEAAGAGTGRSPNGRTGVPKRRLRFGRLSRRRFAEIVGSGRRQGSKRALKTSGSGSLRGMEQLAMRRRLDEKTGRFEAGIAFLQEKERKSEEKRTSLALQRTTVRGRLLSVVLA